MEVDTLRTYHLAEPENDKEAFEVFLQILAHKEIWIPAIAQKCIHHLDLFSKNSRIPAEVKNFINGEIKRLFIFLSFRTQKQEIESHVFKRKFHLAINAIIYNLQDYYKTK